MAPMPTGMMEARASQGCSRINTGLIWISSARLLRPWRCSPGPRREISEEIGGREALGDMPLDTGHCRQTRLLGALLIQQRLCYLA